MEKLTNEDYQDIKSFGSGLLSTPMLDKFFGSSGKTDEEIKELEEKEREEKRQSVYEKSGVSKMFFKASLENYNAESDEEKKALKECNNLIERVRKGNCNEVLLLYGKYGTGKTHLGSSLIRELGGTYRTSFEMCIEYEGCSDYHSKETKLQMLVKYSKEPFLVIDEIGRAGKVNTEKEILAFILNKRYENLLPTVIITNMTKPELMNHLGMAMFDRFKECCISCEFTGESKRKGLRRI